MRKLKLIFYAFLGIWFVTGLIWGCYDFIMGELPPLAKLAIVQLLVIIILLAAVMSPSKD